MVEYLDAITPGMDAEVAKTFQRILTKQGLKFILGAAVQGVETAKGGATVAYKLRKDDSEATPRPPTSSWSPPAANPTPPASGLEALGVEMLPARPDQDRRAFRAPTSPASTPSATPSPARCWPTRPRTRAWRWPRFWPASTAM